MNWLKTSTSSLFQLVQDNQRSLPHAVVSNSALDSSVGAFIDTLIEHRIATTLWVKPHKQEWLLDLQRYQQHQSANSIYLFSREEKTHSTRVAKTTSHYRSTTIHLHPSSLPHQEYFLIALSKQFCGLILAQEVENPMNHPTLNQPLTMILTFEPEIIKQVFTGIKQAIVIGDDTPANLLNSLKLPSPFPSSPDTNFLTSLLVKQTQRANHSTLPEVINPHYKQPLSNKNTLDIKEFINQIAHELRTPLTHMKTALSILESNKLKPNQRQRYLQMLHQQWEHQNSLISGLLDLMELESTSIAESMPPLHLDEFIPGIVSTYQPIAMEKGVQLGYTIPSGIPAVNFPSNELRRVVINLLNNSLKFTQPSDKVSVQASLKDKYVQLAFLDTGVGIAPIDLRRIFDSFYRGRSTPKEETIGAGLGLTIVQQILKRYGGSISVISQQRKGSTFKVLLPIYENE